MKKEKVKQINNEVKEGNFTNFERLDTIEKATIVKTWDVGMKHKYLTRNPMMTEEEFFEILNKIAEGKFTGLCD